LDEKINYLFRTVHPSGRGPWSHPEVRRATGISVGTLSELRNGKNTNPTMETLQRLSIFFGVDPAFFFDTAAVDNSSAVARLAGLAPQSLCALTGMTETRRAPEDSADC
jgi:transcriptional regulator with XRE-family HTH domain